VRFPSPLGWAINFGAVGASEWPFHTVTEFRHEGAERGG
jgi:hypothetical protein